MSRSCRRRYWNNMHIPEEALEDSCKCVQSDMYMDSDECECGFDDYYENGLPSDPMLAQSYVPLQTLNKTFKPSVALRKGTIFPELVSPYEPCQSLDEIAFIKANNEIKGGCNDERD